jgi:hypothetical protein
MSVRLPLRTVSLVYSLALAAVPESAGAIPTVGAASPEVSLTDAWDRTISLSRLRGMPMLVVYEDRGSTTMNAELKAQLSQIARGDRYKQSVALVAVADVTGYDFWPVRGFVKSAIRAESRKQGTLIYCDWDGHVLRALDLDKGTSNVVLFGRDGKVAFSGSGPLPDARRDELIGLLRREVEGAAAR